jgi:PAS domain S-box-containing protein
MRAGIFKINQPSANEAGSGRTVALLKSISAYLGLAVAAAGLIVIVGWAYDIAALKSISPIFVSMKANAAICFILIGLALWMRPDGSRLLVRTRKYFSAILTAIVIAVGLLVLSEYIFGWDAGIDQAIFREPAGTLGTIYPGRIVLTAALSFVLAGLAMLPLIFKKADKYAVPQYLALAGLIISLVAIIGYGYGLRVFLGPINLTPLPLITALASLLLFTGILLAEPHRGPVAVFLGRRAGSVMLWITLPIILLFVIILDWLQLLIVQMGTYSNELSAGVFTVADIIVTTFVLVIIAMFLNRLDRRRWEAEERLRLLNIQLKDNLTQTQLFLSAVFQHAPSPISVITPDGHYLIVNKAWEEFNHISAERATGHSYEDLFPAQVAAERRASDEQILDNLAPLVLERKLDTPEGTRYFTVIKFPLLDARGEVEAIANISTDFTERKLGEEALRESEQKYRSLVTQSPDGIFIVNLKGTFLAVNRSMCESLKYSEGELLSMSIWDIVPEQYRNLHKKRMADILMGKAPNATAEYMVRGKDGNLYYVEILSAPYYEGKELIGFQGIARDITQRKQAEEDLKESEILYRSLIETSPDAIGLMDLNGTIITHNKQALEVFGFELTEDLRGKNIMDMVAPENYKKVLENMEKLQKAEVIRNWELTSYKKDGRPFWVELSSSMLFDEAGKPKSIMTVFKDISERKLSEEKLLKSYESLKKTLNDAINTMVKIVEMRDPYTAGHQQRVAELATAIAREMKLEETQIDQLRMAATIHDIGKMNVPSDILSKPGELSKMEFELVKTHPQHGYDTIKVMDFPCSVAQAVLQHHERLDGSGYPNQLKGEDTLLEAKILAVADVVEAMVSHRPYRPALGLDKALEEITGNKGRLYDEDAVNACLRVFDRGYRFQEN